MRPSSSSLTLDLRLSAKRVPRAGSPGKSPDRLDHARSGMHRERENRRSSRGLPEHGRGAAAQQRRRPPEKTDEPRSLAWGRAEQSGAQRRPSGAQPPPDTAPLPAGTAPHPSVSLPAASPTRSEDTPAGRAFFSAFEDILSGEPDPAPGARALGAETSAHTRHSGRDSGRGKRTVPLRRKRLTRGRRKTSALRARQRVKEQHFPPPRSDRSRRPSRCQHLSPPGEPGRSPSLCEAAGRGFGCG